MHMLGLGLRRVETGLRRLKINPLAYWTWEDVWQYLHTHEAMRDGETEQKQLGIRPFGEPARR